MDGKLTRIERPIEREEHEEHQFELGQWFWVVSKTRSEGEFTWFGCVTEIGSNYATLSSKRDDYGSYSYTRIHFDEFDERCTYEPDSEMIIREKIENYQRRVARLMEEVKLLTTNLSITPRVGLGDGSETEALAVRGDSQPIGEYKEALIKAKEETLPVVFKEIEATSKKMAMWMKAPLLGMMAKADQLKGTIKVIEGHIFNVELYAGLVEEIAQIREGAPATIGEKVRLFQRRAYMDEECLANYRTGGMTFRQIEEFDAWLAEPENLNRILPHQRCIIAFQVRRHTKEREVVTLSDWISFMMEKKLDKMTFLYIRNGEQVFRLSTGIDFGAQLFPDTAHSVLDGVVYAKTGGIGHVQDIISEGEWLQLHQDYLQKRREMAEERRRLRREGHRTKAAQMQILGFSWAWGVSDESSQYVRYDRDTVYYDDISEHMREEMERHNRLVIVLQGLLDRSPVLHPHPPWQLWSYEGFTEALELIFDDSRGLVAGDAPDFEEYRAKCNASLTAASVTVGQEEVWLEQEAEKENERRERSYNRYDRDRATLTRYAPRGNPGPGRIASVKRRIGDRATFEWERHRQTYNPSAKQMLTTRATVPVSRLLNIDAYKPGDFKIFFNDPRTRANYLQWAPLLLEAEEFHAGNRTEVKPVGNIADYD